jgi:hypothetical protein
MLIHTQAGSNFARRRVHRIRQARSTAALVLAGTLGFLFTANLVAQAPFTMLVANYLDYGGINQR